MEETPEAKPPVRRSKFAPQGQYLSDMGGDGEGIRETFVQIARSGVGLVPTSPTYLDLCYPFDSVDHQLLMAASQHLCALTIAGWMRCAGCRHPLLELPYWRRNDAFSRLEVIARSYEGCWGGHDGDFSEGDIVLIGTDVPFNAPHRAKIIAAWGTPGHAMLVELVKPDGTMLTIDGGRGPVTRTRRTVKKDDQGRVWVETLGAPKRRVWGTIRVEKLRFDPEVEWCLPVGPGYPGL
jgi:hypothetical protein